MVTIGQAVAGRARSETIIGRLVPLLAVALPAALRLLVAARRLLLHVSGLGLVTAAAWAVAVPLGLLAAGVSCLVLEYLLAGDEPR